MKLRIKGNSVRLRVCPSEMTRLLDTGGVEESIYFGDAADATLPYALEQAADVSGVTLHYRAQAITVVVGQKDARRWADGDEVGIYGEAGGRRGRVELVVEKDWACLDKGASEDEDTFPNPRQGAVC